MVWRELGECLPSRVDAVDGAVCIVGEQDLPEIRQTLDHLPNDLDRLLLELLGPVSDSSFTLSRSEEDFEPALRIDQTWFSTTVRKDGGKEMDEAP